ncbi:helix-turn-helix domain-containing protein [Propionivibrio dicarboxylicus]|uniref:Regulatory protein, luxR family n=1 Tax=Propionivibrio dicarboxylicus TaxID=83767 RepID=A0A1G8AMB3_9RHOO|nr:helix-turn-helix transcriptional regulator [Propionivibrio dicarboxylicus]SDH22078.1 regulatory protein, luxR family [Propionivibrio dicarboxylicus]
MEQFSRLVLELYGAAHECTLTEFDSHALKLTKEYIGFDSAAIMGIVYSPEHGVRVQSIHLHNQPIDKLLERNNLRSEDGLFLKAARNKGSSIIADARFDNRNKPDMRQYCKKFEVAHGLTLVDNGITRFNLDTISLWRARPKDAYDAKDKKSSELILPHFFKARAINQKINIDNAKATSRQISLLAGFDGCLQFLDEATIEVLTGEWENWGPPILPASFMGTLRRHGTRQYLGKTFVAHCTVHERYLVILLTLRRRCQDLTEAESNVAQLAVRGLSYKEIAKELGRSPATVRNQLHSAYLKRGVSNKLALAHSLSDQFRKLHAADG